MPYYGTNPFPAGTIKSSDIYSTAQAAGQTQWNYAANSWRNQNVYDSSGSATIVPATNLTWNFFRGKYAGQGFTCCGGGGGGDNTGG